MRHSKNERGTLNDGKCPPYHVEKIGLKQSRKAKEGTFICARHIQLCNYIWKQETYILNVRTHRSGSITLSVIYLPYITGLIQRLGHVTLATDIICIRSAVPGTSGTSDDDNDNDGTFVGHIRSKYGFAD